MRRFLFLILLFCSACVSIPTSLKEPKLDLQEVSVANTDFSMADLVFHFFVQNPNEVPINVDKVDYNLKLNGKPLTAGELSKGLKVGANSSTIVDLPVRVKFSDLAGGVTSLLQQGASKYQITGSVKIGLFTIPFDENGEVKLSDLGK